MSSDRDRILEQALKHELKGVRTPPAGACLDADTLGAWTDGGLDAAAMAAAEAHVSNCARCQALVGTMARSTPITSATPDTSGTLGTFPLWKWWLAPIAAGVTAVTLWMVIPEQPQLATAPAESVLAQDAPARFDERSTPLAEPAKPKDADANLSAEQFAQRDKLAAAAREERLLEQPKEQPKENQERKEEAPLRQQENARLADAAAAPAAAPPPPAAVALQAPQAGALQKNARAAAAIEIATLDPSLGWRIIDDRIERSEDGGRTWRVIRQNSGDGLTAGSAPSNNVCWFVGRGGRVLLTADGGTTFRNVSLAEPLDLASVAAIDFRTAMIYSVIGRRFRTEDSGRSWMPF